LVVNPRERGPPKGIELPDPPDEATVPCITTDTSCPTVKSEELAKLSLLGIVKLPESTA
jgi:hypothetical protein